MLKFYWLSFRNMLKAFWKAVFHVEGIIAVVFFVVLLFNRQLGAKLLLWEGINPGWAWLPIGLLFVHLFLKATYDSYHILEQEIAALRTPKENRPFHKFDESHRWIKEKLARLAQQATEAAAKIRNSTEPIEPQLSRAWRTPTLEVLDIQDKARMEIFVSLGKEQGELFVNQKFGSALPQGYAENLATYLLALAENL